MNILRKILEWGEILFVKHYARSGFARVRETLWQAEENHGPRAYHFLLKFVFTER